ncbi:thiamine biosynthesis protein ThiS [candidate division WOR-1 bacterium RIFOXYD2_FULL_36_8]|uniref:Thiamine biosynthesis protein ThiS n=1 Tax=candidate division WOR-1 bacterium RIFOXYB2_FULL_36_35 TaxID=1802578 RepID=A0A1F4RZ90_UNCSA|nr:MAG: thiamine biosynthesis protein ThiS [candidate division WOR-1 bacterium RIFOXYA2_FULL_36_21]OGC13467.1 MAG: thiamine biosynthesis protein ThiS [candidate division WOR-1 bacterium RIFOXYB2_FULL_36_35]OGC21169.1 MAG: thiamine biosynthesis protein ThiS [candidate division WOR-1 bacterium RIFOXYA12_FULL_36_13]OGC38470.1 MAG: thiamine biosynthesis protein ThiS [candidate division WOR-1 bacterium RIFOXYD2_FULL_36_8]
MIKVIINGENHEFKQELTVLELIQYFNLNPYRIVVQINDNDIVEKEDFKEYKIKDKHKVELIKFMAGG